MHKLFLTGSLQIRNMEQTEAISSRRKDAKTCQRRKRRRSRRTCDKQRKAAEDVAISVASSEAHGANEGKFKQLLCGREIAYHLLHFG